MGRAPLSNEILQRCVVLPFAPHLQTDQRKICLRGFRERKRDKRLPFGQKNWLRGLDLNQRSRLGGGIMSPGTAELQ